MKSREWSRVPVTVMLFAVRVAVALVFRLNVFPSPRFVTVPVPIAPPIPVWPVAVMVAVSSAV